MSVSPLLQRFLDETAGQVPQWMGRVSQLALLALRDPKQSRALQGIGPRPTQDADVALRRHEASWGRRVADLLRQGWQAELAAASLTPAGTAARAMLSADALTLVDEAQAEENIELLRAVQLVELVAEEELRELQARVATLRGETTIRKQSNLLRPELIVRAVWDASDLMQLNPLARKALMRASGGPLSEALRTAYAAASLCLADWGIAPAAWKASAMPGARRASAPNSGYDLTQPGALDGLRARVGPRGGAGLGLAMAGRDAQALRQMDLRVAQLLASPADPVQPDAAVTSAGRLMLRLPALETLARDENDREVMLLIALLFEAVLDDTLVLPSVRAVLDRLQAPLLRIGLKDSRLLDDYTHPSWQLLIRLASHAAGFQDEDDARLLAMLPEVDRLFASLQAAETPDAAQHAQALKQLEALLSAELAGECHDAQAPIARLQAAARREALREALRRQVELQLREATLPWQLQGERSRAAAADIEPVTLGEPLQRFLTGPWIDVLAHAVLHDGEHAEVTRGLQAVVPDLLASLQPLRSGEARQRLMASVPGLVGRMQQGMVRIAIPVVEREAVLDALMARHTELLRPGAAAKSAAASTELTPEEIVRRMREEDVSAEPASGPFYGGVGDSMFDVATLDTVPAALMPDTPLPDPRAWLKRLAPGQWCRLVARGNWSVARVLWVDPAREHWLFSDAEIGLTHGLTRRALDRLAASGLAMPLEERNVIERAVDRLLVPRPS
jgi:hypothetical protein